MTRLQRPSPDADAREIEAFVRAWVAFAAAEGLASAMRIMDRNPSLMWSAADFADLTDNHFGDGESCVITDPAAVADLEVETHALPGARGWVVGHRLALNGRRSDLTALVECRRTDKGWAIMVDFHIA